MTCTPALTAACTGTEIQASKRVVRLTFNQFVSSIRSLLGTTIAAISSRTTRTIPSSMRRTGGSRRCRARAKASCSPTTSGTRPTTWRKKSPNTSFDNFGTVTSCTGTNMTDTCAQNFVRAFAAKAYRRPLDATETTDINKVYTDVKALTAPGRSRRRRSTPSTRVLVAVVPLPHRDRRRAGRRWAS